MITIILALIESIWNGEYNDLYVGTVLIDLALIFSIITIVLCHK